MLTDTQVSVLCDIAQSVPLAGDRRAEVDRLVKEGYVAKDGDLYELTPKAEKILSDRGAGRGLIALAFLRPEREG
jgi:hypothetical protein